MVPIFFLALCSLFLSYVLYIPRNTYMDKAIDLFSPSISFFCCIIELHFFSSWLYYRHQYADWYCATLSDVYHMYLVVQGLLSWLILLALLSIYICIPLDMFVELKRCFVLKIRGRRGKLHIFKKNITYIIYTESIGDWYVEDYLFTLQIFQIWERRWCQDDATSLIAVEKKINLMHLLDSRNAMYAWQKNFRIMYSTSTVKVSLD